MDNRSPARSTFGDGAGSKSSVEESDFAELHGGFPKLNDFRSSPMRSRNVSPSLIMGRSSGDLDNDGVGMSPARSRNLSKSPVRDRRCKSPMSVRTQNVSRSPIRGVAALNRSPARTHNENISKNADKEQGSGRDFDGEEKGVRSDKMAPKTSFNLWLPDDDHGRESKYNNPGRRKTWRTADGYEVDKISERKEFVYADEHIMTSEGSFGDPINGNAFSKGKIDRDSRFRGDYVGGNVRPRVTADQWHTRYDEDAVIHGNSRVVAESEGNLASSGSVDGPSSYHVDSIHGYGHSRHSFDTQRGSTNIHYLEHLEFIQGSKQQFSSKQFSESDDNYLEEEHMRFRGGSMQRFPPDNDVPRRSYFNYGPGLHEREDMYDHPPLYEDPFAGQMRRDHHPELPQYQHRSMMGYVPRNSLDFDQESLKSYHNGDHIHHPSCSCSLCEVNDWQGHDRLSLLGYRMPPIRGTHPTSSHSMNGQRRVTCTYDPRMAHTGPRERPPQLAPCHARRVLVASQNKQLCLPIAGGSPFVLCHRCSELLKLPGKFMTKHKKECNLQCGACSCIMSFDLQNRNVGFLSSQKKPDPVKDVDSSFDEVVNEPGPRHRRDNCAATTTSLGSYDFDAMGNSFQSMESEAIEASRRQRPVSNIDGNARAISPPSRSSKDVRVSDSGSVQSSPCNSSEMPFKIRLLPGSPLQDHLDHGVENVGYYNEKGKQILEKDTSLDSSMVNTVGPSETEVYSHELSPSLSDSEDVPREYKDVNKDKPSSISGFLRGFKSKSGHTPHEKSEVYVNGQQVPLHVVKKAEKLAGPILPGDYWYDPKAGFWGVMGEHCLGIIPPSIQEFSFPMSENCSRGDTSVYVNGRELQKRDLDVLTKRGLPAMRGKRYIIAISGKVIEEQSKNFIVNLGKLAPTVEKNRCGFGMHVPEKLNV